jgi:hypothetical protein
MSDRIHEIHSMVGQVVGRLEEICDRLERHDHAIYGNGKPGIEKRLDRVEVAARQAGQSRKAWWSAVVSVLGAVGSAVAASFHKS